MTPTTPVILGMGQLDGVVLNMPPHTLPAPGSTPDASTLTGNWDIESDQANLVWTAATNSNLDDHQVRMSPGATYDADTTTVVATVPSDTLSLITTTGLDNPGDVASFKVFVRLTTGNEAGRNTVTITRP